MALKKKLRVASTAVGLALLAYIFAFLWAMPLGQLVSLPQTDAVPQGTLLWIEYFAVGLAAVSIGVIYLYGTDRDSNWIDISVLSSRQILFLVAGIITGVFLLIFFSLLTNFFSAESSQHTVQSAAVEGQVTSQFALSMVVLSFVLIAPAEEFIFRNIVQKHLYQAFSRLSSVIIASVCFVFMHLPAYYQGVSIASLLSLSFVFVLSCVIGGIYSYTEDLLVPIAVHGSYNATVFLELYLYLEFGITYSV